MTNSKFESLWILLKKYNFIVPENNENELICILCKRILIEAKQAHCACKYCTQCINKYLSDGPRLCPGPTVECKEEDLDLTYNICDNYATNRKISKLIVKCPTENCTFEDMLVNMKCHINTCGKPEVTCPYFLMGCDKASYEMTEIEDHLQKSNYKHADMLVKTIENFKNDIETLTSENNLLKEELQRKQLSINKLKQRILEMAKNYEQWELEQKNVTSPTNETKIINPKVKMATSIEPYGVLIWKIKNLSSFKAVRDIDSKPFLTHINGYRMQIRMVQNVMKSLMSSVAFYPNCIRGDNDDYLVWPFNCKMTLGIIDQSTGKSECEQSRHIEYYSPIKSHVSPFTFQNYRSLVSKDCLTIKCSIEIS